jgi:hypothetical protein
MFSLSRTPKLLSQPHLYQGLIMQIWSVSSYLDRIKKMLRKPQRDRLGSRLQFGEHSSLAFFESKYPVESLFSQNALSAALLANLGMVLIRLLTITGSFRVSRSAFPP